MQTRSLQIGDVLLYAGSEHWLAGGYELEERGKRMLLFRTPGGERGEWVAQLDPHGRDVALLNETLEVPAGQIPDRLVIGGIPLMLMARGSARVSCAGEALPFFPRQAQYTFLAAAGGRLLLTFDFDTGQRLALTGERMSLELMDILPGGDVSNPRG